jgi:hypothetical protein
MYNSTIIVQLPECREFRQVDEITMVYTTACYNPKYLLFCTSALEFRRSLDVPTHPFLALDSHEEAMNTGTFGHTLMTNVILCTPLSFVPIPEYTTIQQ